MSYNDSEVKAPLGSISVESQAKFAPDGSPLRFTGVTVICHLREAESHDTIYRSVVNHCYDTSADPSLNKYVQLPQDSLHMTLLDTKVYNRMTGSTVAEREKDRAADMIRYCQAFSKVRPDLQKYVPIKMMVDLSTSRKAEIGGTLVVPVKPSDGEEANKLRSIRNALSSAFNMSPPDEGYGFHISAYYNLQPLSNEEFSSLQENWATSVKRISEMVSMFEIDRIELCSFDSMFHFEVKDSISVDS